MTKTKTKYFVFLNIILFIYSLSAVLSKLASSQSFFSVGFFLYYGAVLLLLFVYALLWQQILKKMSLVTAFTSKSVTIVWGMIFGRVLFSEKISINMILGSIIIFLGIFVSVNDNE